MKRVGSYVMKELTGKEVAESIYTHIRASIEEMVKKGGRIPSLAVILVGDDPASQAYVGSKQKMCEKLGYGHKDIRLPGDTSQEELMKQIYALNDDDSVDGILVQLPLPSHLDETEAITSITPEKDVDGLHPSNLGKLVREEETLYSCTPHGIYQMLKYYGIEISGKHVVVVGRSTLMGKPMALLLAQKGIDATVTICHSRTKNLAEITSQADILIAAIGRPHMITSEMVKEGAVVIDVGINRVDDPSAKRGYRLTGDVDFEDVKEKSSAITPVPRGVGVMTIAMLMDNTLIASRKRQGL